MNCEEVISLLGIIFSAIIIGINFYLIYRDKPFKYQLNQEIDLGNLYLVTIYNTGTKAFFIRSILFDKKYHYYKLISVENISHGDIEFSTTSVAFIEIKLPLKIESGEYFTFNISEMIKKYQKMEYNEYYKNHSFSIQINNKIVKIPKKPIKK